ncbi:MAG: VOC family protein [Pseudomonadota bacterium]
MSEQTNKPTVVWAEIAVSDLERARQFYGAVLQRELNTVHDQGPNPMVPLSDMDDPTVSAHLYPGTPSEHGNTIHITAPGTLEEMMDRVSDAGGEVESDPIPLPIGRFCYVRDLDRNSIGLVEFTQG